MDENLAHVKKSLVLPLRRGETVYSIGQRGALKTSDGGVQVDASHDWPNHYDYDGNALTAPYGFIAHGKEIGTLPIIMRSFKFLEFFDFRVNLYCLIRESFCL